MAGGKNSLSTASAFPLAFASPTGLLSPYRSRPTPTPSQCLLARYPVASQPGRTTPCCLSRAASTRPLPWPPALPFISPQMSGRLIRAPNL